MQWLIPVITALWGVWKWSSEHDRERLKERSRQMALYVNPFLSASEDLQSRIYHILHLNGLRFLKERYPDGIYAEETLYLMVRWFGWFSTVLRYGPYTKDPIMIRLAEAVRNAFASPDYPVGPFTFLRPEQKTLGKMVMDRYQGQYGIELDTISWSDFMAQLKSPPLADDRVIQQSLQILRQATDAASIPGRERLAEAQSRLVDLLYYVEAREGFTLFPGGVRKKCFRPAVQLPGGGRPAALPAS
ncbi:MAG: hypothetical protein M0017_08820 [Desulfobacteraceae bacterium]|nr:hypothetical protein [Desulfobacteraceae bacterium]